MNEDGPAPRSRTVRAALAEALRTQWLGSPELSSIVGISQKQVPEHLEHLRKSTHGTPERFEIDPSVCLGCAYTFEHRDRLRRPSRCPRCRCERISLPKFRLTTA